MYSRNLEYFGILNCLNTFGIFIFDSLYNELYECKCKICNIIGVAIMNIFKSHTNKYNNIRSQNCAIIIT